MLLILSVIILSPKSKIINHQTLIQTKNLKKEYQTQVVNNTPLLIISLMTQKMFLPNSLLAISRLAKDLIKFLKILIISPLKKILNAPWIKIPNIINNILDPLLLELTTSSNILPLMMPICLNTGIKFIK